jgi:hypothetical protein
MSNFDMNANEARLLAEDALKDVINAALTTTNAPITSEQIIEPLRVWVEMLAIETIRAVLETSSDLKK